MTVNYNVNINVDSLTYPQLFYKNVIYSLYNLG